MKTTTLIFIIAAVLSKTICNSQTVETELITCIPSIKQEATSIWRTINDIKFFEEHGYNVNLPEDELIDSLILKSTNGAFGNSDFPLIYELLESKIYDKHDYKQALVKVKEQEQLINNMIHQLKLTKNSWDWGFKMFDNYEVVFTLYGSGGSYDPNEGVITLYTTKEGMFKSHINPANTIIHEIVHMGIEKSIVQKYNLSHALKERVVDTIVYLLFKEQLPEYKIQNMGDNRLDDYLKDKADIKKLNSLLENL